jgi:hypothetical protein
VFVIGTTISSDYPTTPGAYDTSFNGGYCDVFVSKITGDLSALSTPDIDVQPSSWDYGDVNVGSTSDKSFTV